MGHLTIVIKNINNAMRIAEDGKNIIRVLA
jgi:hypothetical protein